MLPTLRKTLLRRRVLLLAGVCLPIADAAGQTASPPQPGDRLVFETGPQAGSVIDPAALAVGGPPVRAWPMDPANHRIRNGTRNNQILLVRLDPARLGTGEAPLAAAGVTAYSAICTHAGCAVSGWKADNECFLCPCHGSVYDPANGGRVLAGPAPRPLPALPLRLSAGQLTVAGGFDARIGGSTGRTD